jgi:hypothetical protein
VRLVSIRFVKEYRLMKARVAVLTSLSFVLAYPLVVLDRYVVRYLIFSVFDLKQIITENKEVF